MTAGGREIEIKREGERGAGGIGSHDSNCAGTVLLPLTTPSWDPDQKRIEGNMHLCHMHSCKVSLDRQRGHLHSFQQLESKGICYRSHNLNSLKGVM